MTRPHDRQGGPGLTGSTLKPWHRDILACLDDVAFIVSADVGKAAFGNLPRRSASGAALGHLVQLAAAGLVEKGDDKTPIIWRRTAAGRAALAQHGESADG